MKQESATNQTRIGWIIGGAALGAIAMYVSDPDRGRQRRSLATDKVRSVMARTGDVFDTATRDLGNRMQGLRARATSAMPGGAGMSADDQVLTERVRKELGRAVSHPQAIDVTAQQGCIILSGPILAHEKQQLLDTVRGVQDVSEVQDQLEVHERAEGIPSLQGSGKQRSSMGQESWPPGLRALAILGAGTLAGIGLTRRTPASLLLATAGLAVAARGAFNVPFKRMTGMGAGRQAVTLRKTIHIDAPPDRIFDLWSSYENFPRFMSNVKEVRDLGNGRSHWVVSGPAGVPVEWDATITESRRPEILAWRSEPDATVENSGRIQFQPDGNGTRISVQMSYRPPAGMAGHAIASLFQGDPKQQMDDDLMRMKAFIETGKVPHDAAQPAMQQTTTAVH